jgi:hypothetical protein
MQTPMKISSNAVLRAFPGSSVTSVGQNEINVSPSAPTEGRCKPAQLKRGNTIAVCSKDAKVITETGQEHFSRVNLAASREAGAPRVMVRHKSGKACRTSGFRYRC